MTTIHHRYSPSLLHKNTSSSFKRREVIAWILVLVLSLSLWTTTTSNNNNTSQGGEQGRTASTTSGKPYFEGPVLHSTSTSTTVTSQIWHGNGSPYLNPNLKQGSCWCSSPADNEYCLCTPNLAIDLILRSGDDHYWVVKRKDTGQFAIMGGFVDIGETPEEAVARELKEEMNIDLSSFSSHNRKNNKPPLQLFGVYGDPMRDARRHTTSVVYEVYIPESIVPTAGDDAKNVQRVSKDEIRNLDFFADHTTIVSDFLQSIETGNEDSSGGKPQLPVIKRSLCKE